MTTKNQYKLKSLLALWPKHTVLTSRWLLKQGLSHENLAGYQKSGWVRRVGSGAFQQTSDNISWEGTVYGLQKQHPGLFHIGGRTALELLGAAHFIPLGQPNVFLFCSKRRPLPLWFVKYVKTLEVQFTYLQYTILPPQLGMTQYNCGDFQIEVSSRERAALELVELLGRFHKFEECRLLFENLGTLRAEVVQELLESCTSIKAKRVFLFLAKNLGHKWFKNLDISCIDMGSGPRDLSSGGQYDPEFQITYPKGFFDDDKLEV